MDIKTRRTALGLSRKELAQHARVDPSVLQLIELGLSNDDESKAKVDACLTALENPGTTPADAKPNGPATPEA